MESLSIKRIALVLGIGAGVALAFGGLANALNIGRDAAYVLGATAIALVAGLGVPWALDWKVPVLLQRRDEVQAHKTAVVADEGKYWVAFSYDDAFVIAHRLQQHGRAGVGPVVYSASGAVSIGPLTSERVLKGVQVRDRHRHDPTMFRRHPPAHPAHA
jgi:hypothetical protein